MRQKCLVTGCESNDFKKEIYVFSFPKNKERFDKWVEATKNQLRIDVTYGKRSQFVCILHFDDKCFKQKTQFEKVVGRKMKLCSVPPIFPSDSNYKYHRYVCNADVTKELIHHNYFKHIPVINPAKKFCVDNTIIHNAISTIRFEVEFRNQYDSDVTVWSPQGRLHQVEYAMEAVKLGSATVGLKNKDYAVLVALKRASSELSSHQKKIIPIYDHLGISIAGITADARILSNYLRTECLGYKYSYDTIYPVARLILNLGNKMQTTTQRYDRRPYGVGLLVAGYDDQGPHIYQVVPSANYFNCKAMSIGSRSQSARTYLERHLKEFADSSKDDLICHGIQALRGALPNEDLLAKDEMSPLLNISIGIVGKDQPFKILDEEESRKYMGMAKTKAPTAPPTNDPDDDPTGFPSDSPDEDQPRPPPNDPQVAVAMET